MSACMPVGKRKGRKALSQELVWPPIFKPKVVTPLLKIEQDWLVSSQDHSLIPRFLCGGGKGPTPKSLGMRLKRSMRYVQNNVESITTNAN